MYLSKISSSFLKKNQNFTNIENNNGNLFNNNANYIAKNAFSIDKNYAFLYFPNIRNSNISFKGTENLKKLYAYSPEGKKYMLKKDLNGAYLVDAETITKVYYGKDAKKMLDCTKKFDKETQIICPKGCRLLVETDGEKIPLRQRGAIIIGNGKEAKIRVLEGNPLVITSEREPVWYSRYSISSTNKQHRAKFRELAALNYHLYSGHISIEDIGDDIAQKLIDNNAAILTGENYIQLKQYYNFDFERNYLHNFLTDTEVDTFMPHYKKAYKLLITTKDARKAFSNNLNDKIRNKLIKDDIIIDLSRLKQNEIYWKKLFENQNELEITLKKLGYSKTEQREIIRFWNKTNKLGFDYSGLKYLSDDIAIYELDNKLNSWSRTKTERDTHSLSATSTNDDLVAPYIGVSEISTKKDFYAAIPFKKVRSAETLHSHPARIDKSQTEMYIVTNGSGAITIVDGNKLKTIVLKEGEGLIIQPGVKHCINAVKGKYQHLVCQIPSTFQYGFDFKISEKYPKGTNENQAIKQAIQALED